MAGMLPGVECARRRRFHQSGGYYDSPAMAAHNSTRRSSFCLYTSKHESIHFSSSLLQRSILYQAHPDENLGGAAREAKERLDERLRAQMKSETRRQNSKEKLRCKEGRSTFLGELQIEVYGSKKNGSRKFSWTKFSWKASEQDDCAVCLEPFRVGETLIHLPCAHRFHSKCLEPWLQNNTNCPCCRNAIISQ
ncbi:hypothetical protein L6164_014247 [Bauhinia variegata]|uniref:Uncharacterized protein n=1 Tax=Bauhinia variegata TaxID=167791 RepID=A0ACB9NLI5_BAUVA|nr:hypothetical protein L6164_014247 [Bauhinia variegata]